MSELEGIVLLQSHLLNKKGNSFLAAPTRWFEEELSRRSEVFLNPPVPTLEQRGFCSLRICAHQEMSRKDIDGSGG